DAARPRARVPRGRGLACRAEGAGHTDRLRRLGFTNSVPTMYRNASPTAPVRPTKRMTNVHSSRPHAASTTPCYPSVGSTRADPGGRYEDRGVAPRVPPRADGHSDRTPDRSVQSRFPTPGDRTLTADTPRQELDG